MRVISLRAVPNQRFSFVNGQDRWQIEIKVAIESMICSLWLNEEAVLLGSRIVAGVPMIPYPHMTEHGNFGILTDGDDEPWWQEFGKSQQMIFWPGDEA